MPDLVLVDLPGLTQVAVGNQKDEVVEKIKRLVNQNIAQQNVIILAVTPANQDIANSESLRAARRVDETGSRTIGVLTKCDLMDHGTDAVDILSGKVFPLKLGFVGVVCRSQQDIQTGKPMADALKAEADFFKNHPAYAPMAMRCGTPYLAQRLSSVLMAHVRDRMPTIKANLTTFLGEAEQRLASFGTQNFTAGTENKGVLVLQLMTKFASSFTSSIDGTSNEMSTKGLCGGALIYDIFNIKLAHSLEAIDPTVNLSKDDIRNAIRNSTGPRPSLFVPELAFDLLVKPQIKLLEGPSQRCVAEVYQELISICHSCGSNELKRFPRLQAKLIETVSDLLRERLGPCSSYVESLVAIQRAYINTNHPNFLGAAGAMAQVVKKKEELQKNRFVSEEREKRERRRIREIGATNGTETPEEDEAADKLDVLPHRSKKGVNGAVLSSRLNGPVAGSPQKPGSFASAWSGYNLGKEETNTTGVQRPSANPNLTRHVSQSSEPNITQSIRAQEDVAPLLQMSQATVRFFPSFFILSKLTNPQGKEKEPELSEREEMETELIRTLISSYFDIVRESIADQVPKAVMHLLVNHTRDEVQNRLVSTLYKEQLFDGLLHEDDSVRKERERSAALVEAYREGLKILAEVV